MEPVFIFSAVMAVISLGGISGILLGIVLGKIKV
jgi:predicted PurR-regulated permease PerM